MLSCCATKNIHFNLGRSYWSPSSSWARQVCPSLLSLASVTSLSAAIVSFWSPTVPQCSVSSSVSGVAALSALFSFVMLHPVQPVYIHHINTYCDRHILCIIWLPINLYRCLLRPSLQEAWYRLAESRLCGVLSHYHGCPHCRPHRSKYSRLLLSRQWDIMNNSLDSSPA